MAIPVGLIAMWSGALATIPANWNLCDGTGVTPNLVARFLRGAPAATDPGTVGGADSHTHASMTTAGSHSHTLQSRSHSHTTNSAGSHSHGSGASTLSTIQLMGTATGGHSHTTNSDSHSHSSGSAGNHTHTRSTDDGRPPYYEVAFIQAAAGAACAPGLIIIWTGLIANIPANWDLCDGGGGRPDLRSRFLRGVNTGGTDPGAMGGATTHLHTEGSASHNHGSSTSGDSNHSHSFNAYTWTHSHNSNIGSSGAARPKQDDSSAGNHTHANTNSTGSHTHTVGSGGGHAHTVNPASSLPSYYAVAYIYNTAAADIATDGILIWTGILATIPANYDLCDGGGGRPELRSKFIYGAAGGVDPGGTGGSDTHTHTDSTTGAHNNHTIGTTGAHQHNATNSIGSHTHSTSLNALGTGIAFGMTNTSAGSHSHTFNNEGSHNHVDLSAGNHNHNPWSTDDGRPAFYEVAFVSYSGAAAPPPVSSNMAAKLQAAGVL